MAEERKQHNLNFLEDLSDYKVASGDPDVRGWELVDRENNVLGKVDHLLADVNKKRVRYLDVDPDSKMIKEDHEAYRQSAQEGAHQYRDKTGDIHMIVPIGMARLDRDNHRVIAEKVSKETFLGGPRFSKGQPITRDQEREVKTYYEDPVAHRGATVPASEVENTDSDAKRDKGSMSEASARDTAAAAPASTESSSEKTISTEDNKHSIKTSAENTGNSPVPDHDQRKPRSESESREELKDKMEKETHLGEDPQLREAQYRSQDSYAGAKGDTHKRSDNKEERDEDLYRGENFDEDQFYNRKK